jgi:disulfide bond formation protein DsbB
MSTGLSVDRSNSAVHRFRIYSYGIFFIIQSVGIKHSTKHIVLAQTKSIFSLK